MPILPWEVGLADRTIRTIGASVILLGIAVAAFVQIGLSSDDAPAEIVAIEEPTPVDPPAQSVADPVATTEPSDPFIYRVGVLAGISTDNFWAFYGEQPSVWNSYILGPTKPALMSLDPQTRSMRNELIAESQSPVWDANGWRVRISLRPDFFWSDGAPVTASDVVYTFNTVRSLGLEGSWSDVFPPAIESMHADDEHELRIEFTERPQLSIWPHAVGLAPVMPRHIWGAQTPTTAQELYQLDGSGDVGGGQLTLTDDANGVIVSTRNPGYPLAAGPDGVEYHVYADETAMVQALAAARIDSILTPKGLAPENLATIEANPDVEIVSSQANGVRYLGFNLERDPMSSIQFRTALALLLDRQGISDSITAVAGPAWAFVQEANTNWYDAETVAVNSKLYSGSPQERLSRAIQGLKDINYTWATEPTVDETGAINPGTGLEIQGRAPQPLTILTPGDAYDPARPEYVAQIAQTLALLGFDARPVETDFDTVVDLAFTADEDGARHYDMYVLGWTLGSPAFPGYYRPLFEPDGELNNTGYASTAFSTQLAIYENATVESVAREALWAMETMLAKDLPYLLLYRSQITEAYRSDRVSFGVPEALGGLQARLGGISDVRQLGQ